MATAEVIEKEITEESIYQAAYGEWIGVLASMWDAIGKDVDERRLAVYEKQFKHIPLGLLEKAVARAIRNNGNYLSVPSIGALWSAIKKETGEYPNMDVLEAVKLWEDRRTAEFDAIVYRFEKVAI